MASDKPKILLIWGYHRKGWIEPFEKLNDQFEFIYLYYLRKTEHEISHTNCRVIYWLDYDSPYALLDDVKPDKLVSMSIDGANSVALNIACKYRKIPTFVFQHGLFYSLQWYLDNNEKEIIRFKQLGQQKWADQLETNDQKQLLKFMLRSIRWNFFQVIPMLIRYILLKRKYGKRFHLFLTKMRSPLMRPDKYLVFTKENAVVFKDRDGADPADFIEIGNPFIDDYFGENTAGQKDYYLLIDEPLAYVSDYNSEGFFSKEQIVAFQQKLNQFALSKGKKLYIKLHPYSYTNDFYLQHENITYYRDTDIPSLIHQALGIFGTSSTLLIPSVFVNKCVIFKVWEFSEFETDCERWNLVQKLDFHTFEVAQIDFDSFDKKNENMENMIKKYMYRIDGKATERLGHELRKSYE